MKRSSPLWGSVSVLIGVVIAILALVRGAWLVPLLRNRRPIVQSELQAFILCDAVFFCELFQLQRAAQKDKIAVTQCTLCKPLRHVAPCPHVNKLCVPLQTEADVLGYGKADIRFSFGTVLQFRALRDQPDETCFCHNTPFCHRHEYLYKKCRQRHLPLAGKYHATSTQIQT